MVFFVYQEVFYDLKLYRFFFVGTGNGMILVELAREGYTNLLGVDYSPKAVELAANIAKDQNLVINYKIVDLLDLKCMEELGQFQVIHDKGKNIEFFDKKGLFVFT